MSDKRIGTDGPFGETGRFHVTYETIVAVKRGVGPRSWSRAHSSRPYANEVRVSTVDDLFSMQNSRFIARIARRALGRATGTCSPDTKTYRRTTSNVQGSLVSPESDVSNPPTSVLVDDGARTEPARRISFLSVARGESGPLFSPRQSRCNFYADLSRDCANR